MTSETPSGDEQLTLPFTVPRSREPVARTVLQVGRRVAGWSLRWAFRIALPVVSVTVVLRSFPYQTSLLGVPMRVQGTLLHRPGLSVDTNLGSWEFPSVDGLPFGVHVSPQNVDVLALNQSASGNLAGYAEKLQEAARAELPHAAVWLLGEVMLGLILGLAAGAVIDMALRYLTGKLRRDNELQHRVRQLTAGLLVTATIAGYAAASYNPAWAKESRLTGTLAAAQLFPDQLGEYYQKSKVQAVLGSVVGIQSALQEGIEREGAPATTLRIMFISDVHLAAVYPLVKQYAHNYDVDLVINTGDESEFATTAEMTPAYVASIASLTRQTPMLWVAGNHDSLQVEQVMGAIPGVTVLGSTQATAEGFSVTAGQVDAFGLRIAGIPDPRVYGGPGAYGSNTKGVTDPLVRSAVEAAVARHSTDTSPFDIFATHEPVAARELRTRLPGLVRQTNSGHLHAQNAPGDIQPDGSTDIDLVEGSTGAGGLDNLVRGVDQPPIEFSIESVAQDCQFTRVLRFQIAADQIVNQTTQPTYGDDVTVSTIYFRPQTIDPSRTCGPDLDMGSAHPL